ncbi:unnamed protein product [Spodoptera littoralis]|uniref:NF-kappa-B-repressing factor n=1 Tax=Spodoptera littoralis TaxID=7109 RepID=A0A9P0I7J8_SPOLI|nr:unnamed protein product [Spodoptera littoralis]CAH1642937.1 unnamed protein product [Spodoptera littoralis]
MSSNNNKNSENPSVSNTTEALDVNWDVEKYRDEHECEDHWQLRKAFMEKWKNNFPEERLVCLARVYTNIEFMGCRYPPPVMQQIAQLSFEAGRQFREKKKSKLQRTFVSASTAAEDRARGIKRVGGEIVTEDKPKSTRIAFVPQGKVIEDDEKEKDSDGDEHQNEGSDHESEVAKKSFDLSTTSTDKNTKQSEGEDYFTELSNLKCLDVRLFRDRMFDSTFGRLVLLIRPWARKIWNIQTSCQVCGLCITNGYENKSYTLRINQKLLVQASGETKVEAKNAAEIMAWERLKREVVCLLIKEQFIAQGDARISMSDVSGRKRDDVFGTPVENSVAMKMMKMMGWQGGGLGADAQGIAEPIKPNLQMVDRAGLGSAQGVKNLRRAAQALMQRYIASDTIDLDLVFTSDFAKPERATLHQVAQRIGLASRSYGEGDERFLVVRKKLDPFSLVRAVIEKGGITPKYQVFLPESLMQNAIR